MAHSISSVSQAPTHVSAPMTLPSSFVGSAKWYHMLYLDALMLPQRYHAPDLFITFTCNPKWPEITAALPNGDYKIYIYNIYIYLLCPRSQDVVLRSQVVVPPISSCCAPALKLLCPHSVYYPLQWNVDKSLGAVGS
jgi:hypothetical protein